jgi:hypothetical protein
MDAGFEAQALEIFRFQAAHCSVYRSYLGALRRDAAAVERVHQIPFMPISFFRQHLVQSGRWQPETVFTSSGTTGPAASRHAVPDVAAYQQHAIGLFEEAYGPLTDFHILALLPAYLERSGSSLVAMVDAFIRQTGSSHSGFYLQHQAGLLSRLRELATSGRKILLWGVTFALLDLADALSEPVNAPLLVMETGGMKGRRRELTRAEVHERLCRRLGVDVVHSEYGMTELFSQAYSHGHGLFSMNRSLRVLIRDVSNPFGWMAPGQTGGINVIDLANRATCSFIETQDLGKVHENGAFEVLGRVDAGDQRGCNLLVE